MEYKLTSTTNFSSSVVIYMLFILLLMFYFHLLLYKKIYIHCHLDTSSETSDVYNSQLIRCRLTGLLLKYPSTVRLLPLTVDRSTKKTTALSVYFWPLRSDAIREASFNEMCQSKTQAGSSLHLFQTSLSCARQCHKKDREETSEKRISTR